ncbi:MAG: hypothetical protein MUE38_10435 [Flavihumibacter sp.]|nr:hypothetical protein [Flavihumibacter sp.]
MHHILGSEVEIGWEDGSIFQFANALAGSYLKAFNGFDFIAKEDNAVTDIQVGEVKNLPGHAEIPAGK